MSTSVSILTILASGLTWTCSLLWSGAANSWISKTFPDDKSKALVAQLTVALIFTVMTILLIILLANLLKHFPSVNNTLSVTI